MHEEFVIVVLCLLLGIAFVAFPRQIAAWFIRYVEALCERPGNDWLTKLCKGGVWVVERITLGRVHDAATAPKGFRLMGYGYLWIALVNWFAFFVL